MIWDIQAKHTFQAWPSWTLLDPFRQNCLILTEVEKVWKYFPTLTHFSKFLSFLLKKYQSQSVASWLKLELARAKESRLGWLGSLTKSNSECSIYCTIGVVCSVQLSVCSGQYALCSVKCAVLSVQFSVCSLQWYVSMFWQGNAWVCRWAFKACTTRPACQWPHFRWPDWPSADWPVASLPVASLQMASLACGRLASAVACLLVAWLASDLSGQALGEAGLYVNNVSRTQWCCMCSGLSWPGPPLATQL